MQKSVEKYRRRDVCGFAWVTPKQRSAAQPMTMMTLPHTAHTRTLNVEIQKA